MAIWIVATVIAGFSSSRGNGDAVPYSLSCPMMSLNALGSNSDIPAKEYYFADSEDEREGEDEERSSGKVSDANFSPPTLECQSYSRFGFPIANGWAMGLGPAARVPFLRC